MTPTEYNIIGDVIVSTMVFWPGLFYIVFFARKREPAPHLSTRRRASAPSTWTVIESARPPTLPRRCASMPKAFGSHKARSARARSVMQWSIASVVKVIAAIMFTSSIRQRSDEPHRPDRSDCGYNWMGTLSLWVLSS